jgi:protein SOK2
LWEDEGSLCFQVEAKGICVARREGGGNFPIAHPRTDSSLYAVQRLTVTDNHFINGTKLLNVAGMTRGRRDGILKSEKMRHVVKIGPMHLKGVW